MKRIFYTLLSLATVACTSVEIPTPAISQYGAITLTTEHSNTRIHLSDNKTVWDSGDKVSVFYNTDANQQWQFIGHSDEKSGEITPVTTQTSTTEIPYIVVAYPYNENYAIDSNGTISVTLPNEQNYAAASFGEGSSIMVAAGNGSNLTLKHTCGWIKLQICGERGTRVESIVLTGENNDKITGAITINPLDGTAQYSSSMNKRKLTLLCGNKGVLLSPTIPTDFYFAIPPRTFNKGISVEVTTTDGRKMTKSTSNKIVLDRNTIVPMELFTLAPKIEEQVITPTIEQAPSSDLILGLRYEPGISINLVASKFENQLKNIAGAGFKYIEIGIAHSAGLNDMSDTEAMELLKSKYELVKKYNLKVWSIHLPYEDANWTSVSSPTESIRKQSVENISRVLTMCAQTFTECKNYVLHASKSVNPSSTALSQAKKSITAMETITQQYGVRLCVENLVGSYCYTLNDLMNVVNPFSNVYVTYDIGHANCKGYDVINYLASIGTKLGTVHLHDTIYKSGDDDHRMIGEGDIGTNFGWGNVYKTMLTDNRYRGVFMFELSGKDPVTLMSKYQEIVAEYKQLYENK